jgi:biopolymer transport protein TolR
MAEQKSSNTNPNLRFIADINITSLADVCITLMIIFMIAGVSAVVSRSGVPVAVPRSSVATAMHGEGVTVTVDKQGKIYIENNLTDFKEFTSVLMATLSKKTTNQVYLNADETVNYGLVINVISKIREAGIENLGLVANPQVAPKIKAKKPK